MAPAIKEAVPAEESVGPVPAAGLRGFLANFTVLKGAQRELWLTFLIKLLIYTAYSVTNKTIAYWLSKDLGFSDQTAGALVGWVWAPAMTIFTLLAGSITDAIGLRRTFFLGVSICTVARTVMITTTNPSLALACGVLPLAVGEALGTPVLLAATRRYSTTAQRSISFSIIYMVMNIGYIAAGWIFDYVRDLNLRINIGGFEPTTYQQLFIVSLVFDPNDRIGSVVVSVGDYLGSGEKYVAVPSPDIKSDHNRLTLAHSKNQLQQAQTYQVRVQAGNRDIHFAHPE